MRRTLDSMVGLLVRNSVAAATLALVEIFWVSAFAPFFGSDLWGVLAVGGFAFSAFFLVGLFLLPFVVAMMGVFGSVRDRVSWFHVATVLSTGAIVWCGVSVLLEVTSAGQARSFAERMDRLTSVLLLGVIGIGLLLGRIGFEPILRRLIPPSKGGRPFEFLCLCGAMFCVGVSGGLLFSLHLDFLSGATSAGAMALLFVALERPPSSLSASSPQVRFFAFSSLFFALLLPGLTNPHGRFLLFSHAPNAGPLAKMGARLVDFDQDGVGADFFFGADCAPLDPSIHPTTRETPSDGIDQDCDGVDGVLRASLDESSALLQGCSRASEDRSILLVTVDALRADVLRPDVMPNLTRLARRGTRFRRAYSPAAFTEYSLLSLFTGLPVSDMLNASPLTNTEYCAPKTLPERLGESGFLTSSFSYVVLPRSVSSGFSERNLSRFPLDTPVVGQFDEGGPLTSARTTRQAIEFLEEKEDKPYFLWLHYADLHAPYNAPLDGSKQGLRRSPYERSATYVDHHLGRLLSYLSKSGEASQTAVVITSDHGEELGEYGREGHGPNAYEGSVKVPLIFWIPGCPPRSVSSPVGLSNLAHALGELAGVENRPSSGALWGREERLVVSEAVKRHSQDNSFVRALYFGDYKLIVDLENGGALLFNIADDPGESEDLYRSHPEIVRKMIKHQRTFQSRAIQRPPLCTRGKDQDGARELVQRH